MGIKKLKKTIIFMSFIFLVAACSDNKPEKEQDIKTVDSKNDVKEEEPINLPNSESISLTTAKSKGEKIKLRVERFVSNREPIWIDLNSNKKMDENEDITPFVVPGMSAYRDYIIDSDVITIYGKINRFFCEENRITSIELANNPSLTHLSCSDNNIQDLSLINNRNLVYLSCGKNNLTSIDFSQNFDLKEIFCDENLIRELDVSHIRGLTTLEAQKKQIEISRYVEKYISYNFILL